ncbi:MAG TPA: hypothetical protein PK239_04530 [Chitinophagales bacterium]|nr:hypothetical protein [Chitinophagales bacterium]
MHSYSSKLLLLMLVLVVFACNKKTADKSSAQQKTEETTAKAERPATMSTQPAAPVGKNSLPGFTPTGDPAQDEINYAKAKEDLYNNNPEAYKAWVQSMQDAANQNNQQPPTPQVTIIQYNDYINLPQARRDYIDAHPELFKIVK